MVALQLAIELLLSRTTLMSTMGVESQVPPPLEVFRFYASSDADLSRTACSDDAFIVVEVAGRGSLWRMAITPEAPDLSSTRRRSNRRWRFGPRRHRTALSRVL